MEENMQKFVEKGWKKSTMLKVPEDMLSEDGDSFFTPNMIGHDLPWVDVWWHPTEEMIFEEDEDLIEWYGDDEEETGIQEDSSA